MSQWLRWDLYWGPHGYKPFSLTTGPHSLMWCAAYQQLFAAQEAKPATTGLQSKKPGLTPHVVMRGSAPAISSGGAILGDDVCKY
ncbi:UNVERIFIED_CONTAM: hypothetical protein FKN15_040615 [Acipenser sinensis]